MYSTLQNPVINGQNTASPFVALIGLIILVAITLMVVITNVDVQYRDAALNNKLFHQQQTLAISIQADLDAISANDITGYSRLENDKNDFSVVHSGIRRQLAIGGHSLDSDLKTAFQDLTEQWRTYEQQIAVVIDNQLSMQTLRSLNDTVRLTVTSILRVLDEAITRLIETEAKLVETYLAVRLINSIQSITSTVDQIALNSLALGKERTEVYRQLGRQIAQSELLFANLMSGNISSGIDKATGTLIQASLSEAKILFQHVDATIKKLINFEPEMQNLQLISQLFAENTATFITASVELTDAYDQYAQRKIIAPVIKLILLCVAVLVAFIVIQKLKHSIESQTLSLTSNQPLERAMLFFEDEMGKVIKGDPYLQHSVPSEIPQQVIDAVDSVSSALGRQLTLMRKVAEQISSSSHGAQNTIIHFIDDCDRFAITTNEISAAAEYMISTMQRAITDVSSSISLMNDIDDSKLSAIEEEKIILLQVVSVCSQIQQLLPLIANIQGDINTVVSTTRQIKDEFVQFTDTDVVNGQQAVAVHMDEEIEKLEVLGSLMQVNINNVIDAIEGITADVAATSLSLKDDDKRIQRKSDVKKELIERFRGVSKAIENQIDSGTSISSSISLLQETVVQMSADTNDIMTTIEGTLEIAKNLDNYKAKFNQQHK